MPNNKNGAAHCPTKSAVCFLFKHFNVSETPIDASDAHKNMSDGILDVWFSIALVTFPSWLSMIWLFKLVTDDAGYIAVVNFFKFILMASLIVNIRL